MMEPDMYFQLKLELTDHESLLASYRETFTEDEKKNNCELLSNDNLSYKIRTTESRERLFLKKTDDQVDKLEQRVLQKDEFVEFGFQRLAKKWNLNARQLEICQLYCDYLRNPGQNTVPPLGLLTGSPGSGKSTVIQAIVEMSNCLGYETILKSFEMIPIVRCGRICFRELKHRKNVTGNSTLLIVDDISERTLHSLDQLNQVYQQERKIPFGGIPVLMAGDMDQVQPLLGNVPL